MWIEWQRLNTPEHRERFDGGFKGRIAAGGPLSFPIQIHIVHEGGQLFSSGPVADSGVISAGVRIAGTPLALDSAALELIGLASRFVPNRAQDDRTRDGSAFFGRAEAEKNGLARALDRLEGKELHQRGGRSKLSEYPARWRDLSWHTRLRGGGLDANVSAGARRRPRRIRPVASHRGPLRIFVSSACRHEFALAGALKCTEGKLECSR